MPSKIQDFAFAHRKKILAPLALAFALIVGKIFGVDVGDLATKIQDVSEQAVVEGRMHTVMCFGDADCAVADVQGVCGPTGTCMSVEENERMRAELASKPAQLDAGFILDAGP